VQILKIKNLKPLLSAIALFFSLFSHGQELRPKDAKPNLNKNKNRLIIGKNQQT
jgi:hypothetical protein|tara:strand:- start:635 stop:796 length:162 start_codon:yes stop_codon:yes gene_type:complete